MKRETHVAYFKRLLKHFPGGLVYMIQVDRDFC
jgi:hypothetical protein